MPVPDCHTRFRFSYLVVQWLTIRGLAATARTKPKSATSQKAYRQAILLRILIVANVLSDSMTFVLILTLNLMGYDVTTK
jgi:hypothetical protein